MNTTVTLDRAGRIVLPKSIREALRVGPGDSLEIETEEDHLLVSPVRVRSNLQKEQGVWVYRSGSPATALIPDLIDQHRSERLRELIEHKP